jgi:hypothetical protein
MGDLIIKPESGGSIKLQNNAGTNALVSDNSGNITFAGTTTISGGTISSAVTFPTGHVLQVIRYYTVTKSSFTKSGADQLVNGMTKDITPKGANSDFLIHVRWGGETAGGWDTTFNIQMNGSRVNSTGSGRSHGLMSPWQTHDSNANFDSTPELISLTTLVPTSSVIGTDITFRLVVTGGAEDIYSNSTKNGGDEVFSSELIISEIQG